MLNPNRRLAARIGLAALLMVLGNVSLSAQEAAPAKPAEKAAVPTPKRTYEPSRRVPDYFGQIGLSPEQKESIYKVRAKRQDQIDALEKQIAEAQTQMMAECEAILSDMQKQLLNQRRRAAIQARKGQEAAKPSKSAS